MKLRRKAMHTLITVLAVLAVIALTLVVGSIYKARTVENSSQMPYLMMGVIGGIVAAHIIEHMAKL